MKTLLSLILSLLFAQSIFAGSGTISGKVLDEKGESIIGATLSVEGMVAGARTDLDGKFTIKNLEDGKYTINVSYVSYEKKSITDVIVKNGKSDFLTITLMKASKGLKEIVVKTAAKKESINALLIQQKNLATISDGISGEMIKKTADRNTSDVLKRVSGVTITDNKFAVIRGLADRYNIAMLNGDILPSSESDRKAFAFDIFPSSLLENIVISKAATPDKPAEFAGGIIDITTKDNVTDPFLAVQLGTGGNSISTFKPFVDGKNSSTDDLGFDKSLRNIPSSFPTTEQFPTLTRQQKIEATRLLGNNWGLDRSNAMPLNRSFQVAGGYTHKLKKESDIGFVGAISYARNFRTHTLERSDITEIKSYDYADTIHKDNVLIGSIFNVGYKINDNHRIKFKNSFSINSEDQTILRQGRNVEIEQDIRSNASWFNSNQLLSNQLIGKHIVSKHKLKLNWNLSNNSITRTIPDLRKSHYFKNYQDTVYRAYIPIGVASPFYAGSFHAETKENIRSGAFDVALPYKVKGIEQEIKVGAYYQHKNRSYDARVLGYKITNLGQYNSQLELLDQSQLFSEANIGDKGYSIDEITLPSDSYEATSNLKSAFIMSDNKIGKKIRVVYGIRIEDFNQEVITGNLKKNDLSINQNNTNILPSLNFTYLLNSKTNLRFCASQTLSRPEFRELSPSSFYNYNMLMTFVGNPNLKQTKIQNYDIRYEYFMGKGEMVSASLFYKHFDNPIEYSMPFGSGTRSLTYTNAPFAKNYGVEAEFRKSLGFISSNEKSFWNSLAIFGNLAYIKSIVEIQYNSINGDLKFERALQGQSPYIVNLGLSYLNSETNLGVNLVYNRIGERIYAVGNGQDSPDLYEAPRNVLDLQLSKKFAKRFEMKLSITDIFANPLVYFYNIDKTDVKKFDEKLSYQSNNFIFSKQQMGRNLGLSLSYQIK